MEFLDFIVVGLFACFVAFFVIGFNRQMIEKNKQREEKYRKKMTKFKGEVFMMKFVACAKKVYSMSELLKSCEIHIKTSRKRKENE